MKKLFTSLFFFWTIFVHAGYNYHWALEQKFTTRSSINQINYVNRLIGSLKRDGNWTKLDALWVMAVEAQVQAVYNWKNPGANTLTEVNAPGWIAKQGYTSNGTTSYLNTNFNPATQGVNYTQNSGLFGIYVRTNVSEIKEDMGFTSTTGDGSLIRTRVSDNFTVRINAATNFSFANTDSRGFYSVVRTASNEMASYKNGAQVATSTIVSNAIPSLNVFICARDNNGTADLLSTKQLSIVPIGSGTIDNLLLNTSTEAYMDDIGTGVQ